MVGKANEVRLVFFSLYSPAVLSKLGKATEVWLLTVRDLVSVRILRLSTLSPGSGA